MDIEDLRAEPAIDPPRARPTLARLSAGAVVGVASRAWGACLRFGLTPLYVSWLGVEAYGMVGFLLTLQTLLLVLDLGLATTLARELVEPGHDAAAQQRTADLVLTLERIYVALALVIGLAVLLVAPWIAHAWLHPGRLAAEDLTRAIRLAALFLTCRFLVAFYVAGLRGLERHIAASSALLVFDTVREGGAALVLVFVAPTLDGFLTWLGVAGLVQVALVATLFRRRLPAPPHPPAFRPALVAELLPFASGMAAVSLLSVLLAQMDKVILSHVLPLEELGMYVLAQTLAHGLYILVVPVVDIAFPRFAHLVSGGEHPRLVALYHAGCQLVSALTFPLALLLIAFAEPILALWTRDAALAHRAAWVLRLLAAGTALNCTHHLPYMMQLAHRWTRLALVEHVIAVLVLVPAMVWATRAYGAAGTAAAYVALNLGYALIDIPLMHRRILPGEAVRWYARDVAAPLLAGLAVVAVAHAIRPPGGSALAALVGLACVGLVTTIACLAACPDVRLLARKV